MKNNFEQPAHIPTHQPNQPENHDHHIEDADLHAAYEMAEKVLAEPIDLEAFRDIYGENVDKDVEYVEKMEKMFAKQAAAAGDSAERFIKLARIFEAIVFQHAELSNWFGEYATTIAASAMTILKTALKPSLSLTRSRTPIIWLWLLMSRQAPAVEISLIGYSMRLTRDIWRK